MEALIALIPALPLAGFLFSILVGPRLDHVPVHHAGEHGDGHGTGSHEPGGEGHPALRESAGDAAPSGEEAEAARAGAPHGDRHGGLADESMGPATSHGGGDGHADDHGPVDDSNFAPIPTEEEQRATSPHAGHDDVLANATGADGVIPPEFNDGLGQAGHVAPDATDRPRYRSWIVPVLAVGISWVLSMIVFYQVIFAGEGPYHVTLFEWIAAGDFHVEIEFFVDSLTAMLLLVVSSVGLLVHVYSIGYMDGDRGYWRFFAYLNLFMLSMLLLIFGANFLLVYVGWEAVGLCSYLLIGFWYKKPSAAGAAKKAFIVNRVGDVGMGLGVILIFLTLGTLDFEEVFEGVAHLDPMVVTLIALLLFTGAVGKSAQFPLHVWLPDAMEGPTPVSALIHAATMVNAGVYLVARANPIFAEAPGAMWVVAGIGVFTAIFAAAIALTQNDIKKVLAYSTVSQLGYMFFALGIGAWIAAIFHLVAHGFFKGLLFMGAGSVIHGAGGEQDTRFMGGMRARMPATYWTMLIGSLALSGIPIFAGFWSKDEILAEAFNRGYILFYIVGIVTAALTAFYTFRMMYMTFFGRWRGPAEAWHHVHESAPTMTVPLMILAVPTTVLGLVIGLPPEGGLIHTWLEDVFHHAEELHAGILPGSIFASGHHEFQLFGVGGTLLLLGAATAVGGVWLAHRFYVQQPHLPRRFVETLPFGLGPGMYRASANLYYVDAFYSLVFARGGVLFSNALWWFDTYVIDGAVNGAGWVSQRTGGLLRKVQTGHVENYGLGIAAGLIVVLVVYVAALR